MKDELPGSFKQQQPKDGDDDEKNETMKDETTPTEQDGDGTVKSAAAAALASAAIKAKVGVLRAVLLASWYANRRCLVTFARVLLADGTVTYRNVTCP